MDQEARQKEYKDAVNRRRAAQVCRPYKIQGEFPGLP